MFKVIRLAVPVSTLAVVLMAGVHSAGAAPAGEFDPAKADVSCVPPASKISSKDLDAFLANPQSLLSENPGGGLGLSNRVRSLAASSSKAYSSIMSVVKQASDPQKSAIGAGLAVAFVDCRDAQPDYAQKMASDVADQKGTNLFAAYSSANTDTNVAAVNAAGTSSSAQGGGETATGGSQRAAANNRQTNPNSPFTNTANALDAGGNTGLVDDATDAVSP